MAKLLTIVCAWCGLVLQEGDDPHGPISHGACPVCAQKWLQQ